MNDLCEFFSCAVKPIAIPACCATAWSTGWLLTCSWDNCTTLAEEEDLKRRMSSNMLTRSPATGRGHLCAHSAKHVHTQTILKGLHKPCSTYLSIISQSAPCTYLLGSGASDMCHGVYFWRSLDTATISMARCSECILALAKPQDAPN